MKPKALNFIATAIVGCLGLGETAHASPSQLFPSFPPSCAQQAYAEHVANFRDPSLIGRDFTNRSEPWAEQTLYATELINRFDSPPIILIHEASRGYDKKVTKKQRIAARRLVSYYERKVSSFNPLLEVGDLTYEPGTVTFSCFTATCPQGVQCKSISPRLQAEGALSSLPIRRQFFERIMKWASGVKHLKGKVSSYTATYNQAEAEARRALAAVSNEVFRIDVIHEK